MIIIKKAIITISGGIDSAVVAAIAKEQGYELYFLTVNYGQKNLQKEIENTGYFKKLFKAKEYKIIDMEWLGNFGKSGITDIKINFDGINKDKEYVPFRNTCILSAAIAWAETMPEIEKIFTGSMGGPWICPDNTPEYYKAMNDLINVATKINRNLSIEAPLNHLSKPEIIKLAVKYKIPLEHTWTCVSNSNKPCGLCPPCKNRKESFSYLGIEDPLEYEK